MLGCSKKARVKCDWHYCKIKNLCFLEQEELKKINQEEIVGKPKIVNFTKVKESKRIKSEDRKKIRAKDRRLIYQRDSYMCLNCESSEDLTIDHVVPLGIGGQNHISNYQTLCFKCNNLKANKYIDYRK